MELPSLTWVGLQSALLVAALCGLRHQRSQWGKAQVRRRTLVQQIQEKRCALQRVLAKNATLDRRVVDLSQQVALETHLRLMTDARCCAGADGAPPPGELSGFSQD